MLIADTVATLIEWKSDTMGADSWRPLSTISRVISILVTAFLPLDTATGAIGATAPLAFIVAERFAAAGAILFGNFILGNGVLIKCRCADIAASPIELPKHPWAAIVSLAVVREEEKEEEEEEKEVEEEEEEEDKGE